jgi:hypothetical protein
MDTGDGLGVLRQLLALVQAAKAASERGTSINPAAARVENVAISAYAAEKLAGLAANRSSFTEMLLGVDDGAALGATAAPQGRGELWGSQQAKGLVRLEPASTGSADDGSPVLSDSEVAQHHQQQHGGMHSSLRQQGELNVSPDLGQGSGGDMVLTSAAALAAAPVAVSSSCAHNALLAQQQRLGLGELLQHGLDLTLLEEAGTARQKQVNDFLQAAQHLMSARAACKDAMRQLKKCLIAAKAAQGKVLAAELQMVMQLQKGQEQVQQQNQPLMLQGIAPLPAWLASVAQLPSPAAAPMQQLQLQEEQHTGVANGVPLVAAATGVSGQPGCVLDVGEGQDHGSGNLFAASAAILGAGSSRAMDGADGDPSLLQADLLQPQVQNPQYQQWLQQQQENSQQQEQQQQQAQMQQELQTLKQQVEAQQVQLQQQQQQHLELQQMQAHQQQSQLAATTQPINSAMPAELPPPESSATDMHVLASTASANTSCQVLEHPLQPLSHDVSLDQDWLDMWLDQEQEAVPAGAEQVSGSLPGIAMGIDGCEGEGTEQDHDMLQALLAM